MVYEAVYLAPPFHFDIRTHDRKTSTCSVPLIFIGLVYKTSVSNSVRTQSASSRRTNRLVVLPSGEIIRETHEHAVRENAEFLSDKAGGTYTYH
jgi:hypothetical protein